MILEITPLAKSDLVEIYSFSKTEWGTQRARIYADELRNRMKALAAQRLSGLAAHDVSPGLRRQVSGSHVIWFRREAERILIIRVLHQSRDAGRWISDEG